MPQPLKQSAKRELGGVLPHINLNKVKSKDRRCWLQVQDGVHFAHAAVRFAALGLTAKQKNWGLQQYHLYALAIELAFKSLALRSGASLDECRKASHRPTAMIELIEQLGTPVPQRLKTRLADDKWFQTFLLLTRYPAKTKMNKSMDTTIWLHSDYPEMIAAILETPCKWPLEFDHGSALAEIHNPPSGPGAKLVMFTEEQKPSA
jgi:hypothetical protein